MLQQRREAEAVNGEQDNGEGEDGREEEVKEEVVKEELAEGKEGVTEVEVAEDLGILETPEEYATNDANSPAPLLHEPVTLGKLLVLTDPILSLLSSGNLKLITRH